MGKKNKGRKQVVVSAAQDLESFTKYGARPEETKGAKGAAADQGAAGDVDEAATSEAKMKHIIQKIKQDPDREGIKDLADHFLLLDNKAVDAYCNRVDERDFTN